MVVSAHHQQAAAPARGDDAEAVIWHDLECGGYRADLPLWHELADETNTGGQDGAILDIGAGSGRVALSLARAGHAVTALELDPRLLQALVERAKDLPVDAVQADARDFTLPRRDYPLCIAPMQTLQLLGGAEGRIAFMRRARAHLRPGGVLACAIVTTLEPFDATAGGPAPSPERVELDGAVFISRAMRVQLTRRTVVIERERQIARGGRPRPPQRDVIELDRLSAARVRREGREAGFAPLRTRSIAATDEHVGSTVVMLRG